MKNIHKIYFTSLVVIFVSVFFLFPLLPDRPIITYSITYIVTSLLFILLCRSILRYDIPLKYVVGLLATALILRLALISIHPVGSDDYYRYLWDGKVIASGTNPYRYSPNDSALTKLHSEVLPARVNFPGMRTIYPPVAEILFYLSYEIGGESFIGLKLILFIFDLMTMLGIFLVIKKLGLNYKYVLIYALCPVPLFQFLIDGHVDGFGIPLLLLSILFYIDEKKFLSYLFIGLSICVKPLGLILIPILFFNEKSLSNRIKVLFIPLVICIVMYLPFLFSGSPFQALMNFTENWTFNGIVFDALNLFIRDNQRTRLICAVLLLIVYVPVILSRKDLLAKTYLSVFLLLVFSPVVHPWYLGWLAILLPFVPRWSGITYVSLISLTAFTVLNYQLTGVWKEYTSVLLLEYLPVLGLFGYELIKGNVRLTRSLY